MAYPKMNGRLSDRFRVALKSDFLTDVTFLVGPRRELRRAHSYVLAMVSEVFWIMLFGNQSRKSEEETIRDVGVFAFDSMIWFAYDRTVSFSSIEEAIEVAYAADSYKIHGLLQAASDYLWKHKSLDTIFAIHRTAILLNLEKLEESCVFFMRSHSAQVLESENFTVLPENAALSVVSEISVSVDSGLLFRSLVKWALDKLPFELQEAESPEMIATKASTLRKLVFPFLSFVSWMSLSTKDLLETVRGDAAGILSYDEFLNVLSNIKGNSDVPLPEWCNRNRTMTENPKPVCTPKSLAIKSAYKRYLRRTGKPYY